MRGPLTRLVLGFGLMLSAAAATALTVDVRVARDGDLVQLDAVLVAPVTRSEAWAVLTDFDAMARYVPNLDESRVTVRAGNRLRVEQHGVARWGPLSHAFSTVRDIELTPMSLVQSHSTGGNLQRVRSETRFSDVAGGTRIQHHLEFALETWMPEFLAEAFLRHEVTEQFEALVQEMLRRRPPASR